MKLQSERSIPDLVSEAFAELGKLVANEFDLAKAEISEKVSVAGRAAALIGAGAVLLIPALVVLLFSCAAALIRSGFSDPVAYLITGGIAAIISVGLVLFGASRLSAGALTPKVTIQQVQRDKAAAQEMIR